MFVVVFYAFFSIVACQAKDADKPVASDSNLCETMGDSVDELVKMDDLILEQVANHDFEAAARCIAHQISLGYGTPPNYSDLSIYLARGGDCARALEMKNEYLLLMRKINENSQVLYAQMDDPAFAKIEKEISKCLDQLKNDTD